MSLVNNLVKLTFKCPPQNSYLQEQCNTKEKCQSKNKVQEIYSDLSGRSETFIEKRHDQMI